MRRTTKIIAIALTVVACGPPGAPPGPITGPTAAHYEVRGFVAEVPGAPVCDLTLNFDLFLDEDAGVLIKSWATALGACTLPEFLIDAAVLCQTPNAHPGTGDCGDVDVPMGAVAASTPLSFTRSPDFGHLLYGALVVYSGRSSSRFVATHQIRVDLAGQARFQTGSPN